MRPAGIEQDDVLGVAGVLVGELERRPDLGVAQRGMPPPRDVMKDASKRVACEP
jgi:hypothetical protein